MMEREFVDALMKTIRTEFPSSSVVKPADAFTLGIPDILGWVPTPSGEQRRVWAIAIEAKSLHPLMEDPLHRGRRNGLMLKHHFTGPQISTLRMLHRSQVDAFGLVRASADSAFRIHPNDLPEKTGNFTHEELVGIGRLIYRRNGLWRFWETEKHDGEIPSP